MIIINLVIKFKLIVKIIIIKKENRKFKVLLKLVEYIVIDIGNKMLDWSSLFWLII